MTKKASVPEREIQHAIREGLGLEPDLVMWRNSAGVFESFDERTGKTAKVRTGLVVGASDLLGILKPNGRWFALEVKTDRGSPRPEQVWFIDLIRKMGGFACIVRSVEEARAALARARAGETS